MMYFYRLSYTDIWKIPSKEKVVSLAICEQADSIAYEEQNLYCFRVLRYRVLSPNGCSVISFARERGDFPPGNQQESPRSPRRENVRNDSLFFFSRADEV